MEEFDYKKPHYLLDGVPTYYSEQELEERKAQELVYEKYTIIDQIIDLEANITPRRLREAILGTDNNWLQNINEQIKILRKQL